MRISEVHERLDRRCIIAAKQHSGIFSILSKFDEPVPTYLYTDEGKTLLQMYFNKNLRSNPKLSPVLSRKDVVEKKSYFSISERINNVEGMKVLTDLLEAESVALNNTFLQGDELFVDFRFHRSRVHEINDLLSTVLGGNENFRVARMSGSRSLRDRFEELQKREPVAVVRYSVPVPKDNALAMYLVKNHTGAVAEVENRSFTEEGVKVVLYTEKPLESSAVTVISREDNVYEAYVNERSLLEGRKRGNEARIPRTAFFLTLEKGRLVDTTFIPAAEADEYVSIMMSALQVDHETHPILEYYSPVDEEVWRWL